MRNKHTETAKKHLEEASLLVAVRRERNFDRNLAVAQAEALVAIAEELHLLRGLIKSMGGRSE
jgi:hypothetical protein